MTRFLKKIGFGFLFLLLTAVAAALWYRNASLPQIEGHHQVAGLSSQVEILRDLHGIPHIYASTVNDAYFALGYVHAQDRLWQLEINRRVAAGRLSEILGASALNTDRFMRTLGVKRNAQRILDNLSNETRAALDAYAKGINTYLQQRSWALPPEFILTGASAPEPWEPADSVAWQTMMAWDLGANWTQEVLRMRLAQRLSLEQINEFLPPYPGDAPVKTRDYVPFYRELAGTTQHTTRVSAVAPPSYLDGMGSNNWVVSGALTQTSKPLLANDPHLALSAPSVWYLAHMSAPGLNVIGATLPGIPAVVLGRNDRIAWGFTNTAPDVQDLYIEKMHPEDPTQYQTPDGWAKFATREEVIKVKGEPEVRLSINETRHGPVVSGALPILNRTQIDAQKNVIAFAWTALRPDDLTVQAGIRMNQANNWKEFLEAVKDFHSPQQNMVYADIDGNIGFVAPARVPVRRPDNDLMGLAPAPGWDARYDWDGFIPFEELPRAFNPPSQRIVTANEKIVGPDYPHFLTSEWSLPYRANRINQLLDEQPRHTLTSFARIQKDHLSLAALELLPTLRNVPPKSERARRALEALARWNGEMDADKPEPLIFSAWLRTASWQIFADELGESLMQDYWDQRNVHQPMVNALTGADGQNRWCADSGHHGGGQPRSCVDVLASSLEKALDDIEDRYGKDMSKWRWGIAHAAHAEHRPFSKVQWLSNMFDIRIPTPGDTYTVNVGRYNLRNEKEPFANRHAAVLRALYDLSDLENSRFIHSTGQSGNPLSSQYRDYVQRWADVDYLPMRTRRADLEKSATGLLVLTPQ